MARDLLPEDILKSLEKGSLAPFYLFFGPGDRTPNVCRSVLTGRNPVDV